MKVWSCASAMQTWRYKCIELCSPGGGAADLGTSSHGGMELRSSGGALQACRRGGIEVWNAGGVRRGGRKSSGGLEARCRRRDVEVWSSGGLEARCRRSDIELWRSGGSGARCRCSDVGLGCQLLRRLDGEAGSE